MIALESLLFLVGGVALAIILSQVFGRSADRASSAAASVKLVRLVEFADHHEETHLLINDKPILSVADSGLRQETYAGEVERLEATATKIASALGGRVEFARLSVGRDQKQIES